MTVYGANLLDIAPTALTLLGLPVGADMDGRVLRGLDRPSRSSGLQLGGYRGPAGLHPPGCVSMPLRPARP